MKTAINTSTLRMYELNVAEQINAAAETGFSGIELWMRDIIPYLESGVKKSELLRRIKDSGVDFFNAISFIKWAHPDDQIRNAALEDAKKELDIISSLNCRLIAAPIAKDTPMDSLDNIAKRYAEFFALCSSFGITPMLEPWGHSPILNTIAKTAYTLICSKVPNPLMLLDVFHAYKGEDDLSYVEHLGGHMLGLLHVNDYPLIKPSEITDKDRVNPFEGKAPYKKIMETMRSIGYNGYLSLETFPQQKTEPLEAYLHRCYESVKRVREL